MKNRVGKILLYSTLLLIASCEVNNNKKNNCTYKIENFFKKYDSLNFKIDRYNGLTEIFDNSNITGERGFYKFGKEGNLLFYGYLVNEQNDYSFGIEYDSSGNQINQPKETVVRWFTSKLGNDSLKVSFLLYSINYSYGNIQLTGSDFLINVPLFESKYFSNLNAGDVVIALPKIKRVYITGNVKNNCSMVMSNFRDSVILPDILYR